VDLDRLADPLDAPPVPTDAFKRLRLCAFDPAEAVACFRSSGTTAADRGQHLFRTLDVYRAAIAPSFVQYVLPDLGPNPRIHMLVLAPSAAHAPDSSLYFMLDFLCERFGRGSVRTHFFDYSPGERPGQHLALDVAALCRALEALAAQDEPVLLLGPSFSYVHLFDQAPDFRVALPPRSRLFETGGFKGKSREIGPGELHALFRERLGIEPDMVVGEYSMSELSSQLYDPGLRRALAGRTGSDAGHADGMRLYVPPPWCAVRILDPATLAPLAPGQQGLVAFFDLANVDSVAAVVTGDMGTLVPSARLPEPGDTPPGWHGLPEGSRGLALHGRAAGQSAKGCSLAIDMLLQP
jgi:hypothetical protein